MADDKIQEWFVSWRTETRQSCFTWNAGYMQNPSEVFQEVNNYIVENLANGDTHVLVAFNKI